MNTPTPARTTPTELGQLYIDALLELHDAAGDPAMETYANTQIERLTRTTRNMTTHELHDYLDGIHHALTDLLTQTSNPGRRPQRR